MARIDDIKKYLVEEFLLDIPADELADDYDLLANGVIDSLGLLTLVSWLEDRYRLDIDAMEIAPDNFRSVGDIETFVASGDVPAGAK
ncbi:MULTISPECIES: acyl carrier protein [unclassified Streptomyces]|uniref:acyl carrier protein n=1 Tax=unclassified Streptomyces TaxID=2593676 RepID=UPI0013239B7C|nr:acyl carrier protein [Streptomyces sp. BA2]MWA15151.1 acyl carrier protein [Streptomyces sp. BA2]